MFNELIRKDLREKGYYLVTQQEMTPLFDELDKNGNAIFLTKVQYDYYKEFYPNILLYKSEYMEKKFINPEFDQLRIDNKVPIREFIALLNQIKPKRIYYSDSDSVMIEYHTDVTLYEVLCDVYGVKFEKGPNPIIL